MTGSVGHPSNGRKNLSEIHRFGQFLTQQQRKWLRFLHKRGGVCGRRAPSYQALYQVLKALDPNDLAEALNGWLAILRGALISLKARLVPDKSWPFIREICPMKISLPYNMICKGLFK